MSKKVSQIVMAALALAAVAVLAYGQTATTANSATTTTGKYRIALVEPVEGSSIAADQVRVVLTPNTTAMGDDKTQVDVFLDDQQKGTLKTNETEFRVDGVRPGPHKLVLIARNPVTDQQFDRREINFVATGVGSTTTGVSSVTEKGVSAHVPPAVSSTERKQSYTANDGTASTQPQPQVAQNEMPAATSSSSSSSSSTYSSNAPASSGSSTYSTVPPPAPNSGSSSSAYSNRTYNNSPSAPSGSMSSSSSSSRTSAGGTDNEQLPKTGSSEGLLAIAGAALLVTGAVLRRNA
ncbi:MAG TPA: LPXTG cell wall anchor domain-containing protein [Thermoanaerobaculia bacterium]